ncbi:MAG: hypothetical protein K2P78_03925, partial [Gemmataceae bacterium]|nr:hypothetical protein [Gemmataceae bacterium]
MTPRERKMALTLGVLLLLGLGAVGYLMVLRPLQEGTARRDALQKEVDELTEQADKLRASQPKLAAAKRKSLPANPAPVTKPGQGVPAATTLTPSEASDAKLEYTLLLTRLLARAKIPTTSVSVSDRALDARGIPLIPNTKKPAYLRAAWNVEIRNIDMWELHDFLVAFYQVDLLHQITGLTITRDETPTGGKKAELSRHDLTVKLTAEAIMLDGAERRPNLIVVPSGFAAVGGLRGYDAIAYNPQYPARLINPFRVHPLLATGHRDYSYIVLKDMFHGHLPTAPKPSFDRIPDVAVKLGEPIAPVKVTLGGELPPGPIKWDVKYGGKILPPGSVKVEPSRQGPAATVSLTPAEGEAGFAQVEVIATLPDGKQLTNTLKVGVSALPPKDEISAYIFLTNTTVRSDGTATATIRDRYNPFDYEVRAGRDGVKVQKYWYLTATQRKEDGPTTPQLMIGDENVTATQKVFKVVALDDDGLILLDVTQPPAKPWLMV